MYCIVHASYNNIFLCKKTFFKICLYEQKCIKIVPSKVAKGLFIKYILENKIKWFTQDDVLYKLSYRRHMTVQSAKICSQISFIYI